MKKKENYEGEVLRLKFPNKGLVRVEGEETLVQVKNTLPGQKISFQLTKNSQKRKEGRLLKVLEPSELETEIPPCPHFEWCGGCSYQTLPYEGQKELKLAQVKALLEPVCPDFPLERCEASPAVWEYRNKMEFSFGDETKGGELTLGLHKRGSFYDIVPVQRCQIVTEDIRKIISTTVECGKDRRDSHLSCDDFRTADGFDRIRIASSGKRVRGKDSRYFTYDE